MMIPILFMEEIVHQLRLVVYLIIYRVLYIPGGCLGFLPSTVVRSIPKKHQPTNIAADIFPHSSDSFLVTESLPSCRQVLPQKAGQLFKNKKTPSVHSQPVYQRQNLKWPKKTKKNKKSMRFLLPKKLRFHSFLFLPPPPQKNTTKKKRRKNGRGLPHVQPPPVWPSKSPTSRPPAPGKTKVFPRKSGTNSSIQGVSGETMRRREWMMFNGKAVLKRDCNFSTEKKIRKNTKYNACDLRLSI